MIRLKTFQKILKHFNGNLYQAQQWLQTPHHSLDGIKPFALAEMGKHNLLDQFVDERLPVNSRKEK